MTFASWKRVRKSEQPRAKRAVPYEVKTGVNVESLELHPLCELFPRMDGAEFSALRDDIRINGLRQPIVMHEGKILDGGNRYRACAEVGIRPAFTKFPGGDPISFVLSANFHRRHLSAGQQAAVVSAAQDWRGAHQHGGDRSKVQSLHLDTVADRAKASGASIRTQKMADKVAKNDPALVRDVAHGKVTLPEAIEKITGKRPGGGMLAKKPSKILPRPEPKAKPAKGEPLDIAREHAKKQNAVIKQLRADLAERDARIEALAAELKESRENANELGESLQGFIKADEGTAEAAKEIKRLLGALRVVEATRDQYMTKCNEMVSTVKSLQRKLDKCEAKKP